MVHLPEDIQKCAICQNSVTGTWVFHHKRAPKGIITKFKERYCVRGDLQEDTPETYAPVVSWSTIRLVLFFTLTQNCHLTYVDFNNAFVQADLKDPVWVHLTIQIGFPDGSNLLGFGFSTIQNPIQVVCPLHVYTCPFLGSATCEASSNTSVEISILPNSTIQHKIPIWDWNYVACSSSN